MPPKSKKEKKKVSLKPVDNESVDNESVANNTESIINTEVENNEQAKYNPIMIEKIIYVDKNQRRTSDIMTKFEYAKIIGLRAQQIKLGDNCRVDVGNITDPLEMAKKELREKQVPSLCIERRLNMDSNVAIVELWDVNEMSYY